LPTYNEFPTGFGVDLPAWFRDVQRELPDRIADPDDRSRLVIDLAQRNIIEGTGGPFAALVVDAADGTIVSAGVNLVLQSGLASAHAEVVALSLAQTRTGSWNLGADPSEDRILVVNAQPCLMCLGSLIWSGVRTVGFAASGKDVERITGFDEGPVPVDWREQLQRRGIAVHSGRLEQEAHAVLHDFADRVAIGTATLYNGG
jgi:tRNA(Arg) A34 adenosine deaminase TadA